MTGTGLRIAVFGATSALAQAAVRRWAAQRASLVLVARDAGRLDAVASDALVHGAAAVERQVADFSSAARMPDVAATAWHAREGLDVALLAWGSLTDQGRGERDPRYLAAELEANFVAFACLADVLAGRMRAQRSGTIAIIGSVAGDRARGGPYAYAAAKAGLDAYARGLSIACREQGVRVVLIKPGPIATPMTAHLRPGLLWSTPEAAGAAIVEAVAAGRAVRYVPAYWRAIMAVVRLLPDAIAARLKA
jgi:short-subunit dehydrogenase